MAKRSVKCFDDNGNAYDYIPLSERLPDFEAAYPTAEGWRVEITNQSALEADSAYCSIVKAALEAGKLPHDIGIALEDLRAHIFTATLYSPEGHAVKNATTRAIIHTSNGWKGAETSARQRLVAACGFGGEVFDEDEKESRKAMGHREAADNGEPESEDGNAAPTDTGKQVSLPNLKSKPAKGVTQGLLRNCRNVVDQMRTKGHEIEVPEFSDDDEIRDFLSGLAELDNTDPDNADQDAATA